MGRPENVALRGSTALAAQPGTPKIRRQRETDLLNMVTMP
jgi:hypothetical protein